MFNFPDTPTTGQQVTAANGIVYKWDGAKWASVAGGAAIATGTIPPSSPVVGQLWWDTLGGQLYIYFNDGTSSQWVAASSMTTGVSSPPIVAPPVAASWTQRNFTAFTTATDTANGLTLFERSTTGVSGSINGLSRAVPTAPYTIDFNLGAVFNLFPPSVFLGGVGWTDGVKTQIFYATATIGATPFPMQAVGVNVTPYSNFTTSLANTVVINSLFPLNNFWLRLIDDGTSVTFAYSIDGINFLTAYAIAKASGYLGASGYSNIVFSLSEFALGNGGSALLTLKSMWVR